MRRVIVPVDLGGSPTRCAMRPPRRKPASAATVSALIELYQRERKGDVWEVGFFHGGLPSQLQFRACGDIPIRLACSPADLNRAAAQALWDAGGRIIELEFLTLQPRVLRQCRRGYEGREVWAMVGALRTMGFGMGAVLSPGMPGFRIEDCIADSQAVAEDGRFDFVRVNPALAFEGSDAAEWVAQKRWLPLDVSEVVSLCRAMTDILEEAGVSVARVGLQPGQDMRAKVVAGPVHPNLRGEMQSQRFLERLEHAFGDVPLGGDVELRVNPKDLAWVKGVSNSNIRAIRTARALSRLDVVGDGSVPRGEFRVRTGRCDGQSG